MLTAFGITANFFKPDIFSKFRFSAVDNTTTASAILKADDDTYRRIELEWQNLSSDPPWICIMTFRRNTLPIIR
jgi:hypothetical protein